MTLKTLIAIILSSVYCVASIAQESKVKLDTFCSYNPGGVCGSKFELNYYELNDTNEIKSIAYNVMRELGINRKVYIGRFNDKNISGIFFKLKEDNVSRVLVSQKYVTQIWIALGILFHELGHYINDHENFCSNKDLELDADYYAGYCLSRAGANKTEAIMSLNILPEQGDDTHPPKKDRIERILKGWNDEKKTKGINSFTSITPNVIWMNTANSVAVTIDNQTINFERTKYLSYKIVSGDTILTFDPQFGMLYIKNSNSTYQLLDYNYKDGNEGMGELVNDRTSLVYLRFDNKNWRYYNKGRIILKEATTVLGWRGVDYIVSFQGKVVSFKNFRYAPEKKIMPALYQ